MNQPMQYGLILMSALPPTEGHVCLVKFGAAFMSQLGGRLHVALCVLPGEPDIRHEHLACLREAVPDSHVSFGMYVSHVSPTSVHDDEFWVRWMKSIGRQLRHGTDFIFSSEAYGARLASVLGAEHIVYDPERAIVREVSATKLRDDIASSFSELAMPLRQRLRRRICLHGQESTGKTTLARWAAWQTRSVWSPEWARVHLESLAQPGTNVHTVRTVMLGQLAQQRVAEAEATRRGVPYIFYDTDLLSVLGYWQHWRGGPEYAAPADAAFASQIERLIEPADVYVVTHDSVPFESDPIRHSRGRDTTRQFWADLAASRGYRTYWIKSTSARDQLAELTMLADDLMNEKSGFYGYRRTT